jgi:hypothetical protein
LFALRVRTFRPAALTAGTAPSWSTDLGPGQSVTVGYQVNGQPAAPSGFALNGAACS